MAGGMRPGAEGGMLLVLKHAARLGILPYRYNRSKSVFEQSRFNWKRYHYGFNVILYFAYILFLILRFIFKGDKGTRFKMAYFIFMQLHCVAFFVEFTRKGLDLFRVYVNRLISCRLPLEDMERSSIWFSKEEVEARKKLSRREAVKVNTVSFAVSALITAFTVRVFRNPEYPLHFTSLSTGAAELKTWERAPCALLHFYIFNIQMGGVLLFGVTSLVHSFTLQGFLRAQLRKSGILPGRLEQRRQAFVKYYRHLGIIQSEFNSMWSSYIVFLLTFFVTGMVLNIYQAVVYLNISAIFRSMGATFAVKVLLTSAGVYHAESERVLQSWKSVPKANVYFHKFRNSCRSLDMKSGAFGFVDRGILLTIVGIVIGNAVTLIVGHEA